MTASRSDGTAQVSPRLRRAFSALGLAAALAAAGLPAGSQLFAQTAVEGGAGAPLQLVPRQDGDDSAGQSPAAPAPGAATPEKTGIEVLSLSQYDVDGLGLLDPESSGLGPAPWDGTDAATAVALLRGLPAGVASAVLLSLGERLLLANAPPPTGDAAPGAGFLDVRMQRLFDWGLAAEVQRILARLPHSRQSETTARLAVQALLVDDQDQAACDMVRREIVAYSSQDFWAKALIYCQIVDGSVEQAYLGLDLLRETGATDDPLFAVLAQRFAGADAEVKGDGAASVLNYAMLRHLDVPIPQGFAAKAPRALWPALAASEKLDPLERASLAEAAFSQGLVTAEAVAAAYRALPFTADERAAALTGADSLDGVLGRALLFQAAEAQALVVTRVEILKALLDLAHSERRSDVVLPVVAPMIRDLRPRTDMAWFAETAVRSFYILDDIERARAWLRLIERDAVSNEDAQAALQRLWPYARLRGQQDVQPDPGLAVWAQKRLAGTAEADGPAGLRQVYLLFAAFRAAGLADGTGVTALPGWAEAEEQLAVGYPLLLALNDAGRPEPVGEGLLLCLAALGGRQWGEMAVTETAEILNFLQNRGLTDEVRQLAMEIALANGL